MHNEINYQAIAQTLREFRLKHRVNLQTLPLGFQDLETRRPHGWSHDELKTAIIEYYHEVKTRAQKS